MEVGTKVTILTIFIYTKFRIRYGFKFNNQAMILKLAVDWNLPLLHRVTISIYLEGRGWSLRKIRPLIFFLMISINWNSYIAPWIPNLTSGLRKLLRILDPPRRLPISLIWTRSISCFGVVRIIIMGSWRANLAFGFIVSKMSIGIGLRLKEILRGLQELGIRSIFAMINVIFLAGIGI